MSELAFAKGFKDLIVYQRARQLQREVFPLSKAFPRDESFSLTNQIRRSSRSIGANIAEAWAKRRYERHFVSKLSDAEGELFETQHWIETAVECKYLELVQAKALNDKCVEIGRMLGSMMDKAELFCGEQYKIVRESHVEYFFDSTNATEH